MPQLTGTTIHSAVDGNLSWPYQANVIKTLEQHKSRIGAIKAQFMKSSSENPHASHAVRLMIVSQSAAAAFFRMARHSKSA
jgi:hypothetical protein